ncbi:unnamed protein product [Gongylonema pulchrum]|uniref:Uncharacterized protein n=1 Tax=Gongylonema pulchrum TaxID=637853 RepID=A0A183DVS8_9BILA|nr:unnamed protein product [Gongylonema pulchrum]
MYASRSALKSEIQGANGCLGTHVAYLNKHPNLISTSSRINRQAAALEAFSYDPCLRRTSAMQHNAASENEVSSDCCTGGSTSDLCQLLKLLSSSEQAEARQYLGENCEGHTSELAGKTEKRKPNFIRFGRAAGTCCFSFKLTNTIYVSSPTVFSEKGVDPNFLRFGRAPGRTMDPNFLRFGKSMEPNFLRFGKRLELSEPNFLRFGREPSEEFNRQYRKPNFLRFG